MKKRCIKCGRASTYWHYIITSDGSRGFACADDRCCVAKPRKIRALNKKQRKLFELKEKYYEF